MNLKKLKNYIKDERTLSNADKELFDGLKETFRYTHAIIREAVEDYLADEWRYSFGSINSNGEVMNFINKKDKDKDLYLFFDDNGLVEVSYENLIKKYSNF